MAKKSVKPTEDAINIKLTKEQKKKAREHFRKSGVLKFKIEGVLVKGVPSARSRLDWIMPD